MAGEAHLDGPDLLHILEYDEYDEALHNLHTLLMAQFEDMIERGYGSKENGQALLPRVPDRGIDGSDNDDDEDDSLSESSTIFLTDKDEDSDAERPDDDHLSDEAIDRMLNSIGADNEHLSDETVSRMLTSMLDTQDSDEDEDDLDTPIASPAASPIRTVSLKTLGRPTIDALLDDLYNPSAPGYLTPLNAGMGHMRERMEQYINVALLGAGCTSPC